MELAEDDNPSQYQIQRYTQGVIRVNGTDYTESLIISADDLKPWQPQAVNDMTTEHLQALIAYHPDLIIIGTGQLQQRLPHALLDIIYQQRIGVEVMSTQSACHTFSVLSAEGRLVVAGLIVA